MVQFLALIFFVWVVFVDFLFAKDYLEVLRRQHTESEQAEDENLLLCIVGGNEPAASQSSESGQFVMTVALFLVPQVEDFTKCLLLHQGVFSENSFDLVLFLECFSLGNS